MQQPLHAVWVQRMLNAKFKFYLERLRLEFEKAAGCPPLQQEIDPCRNVIVSAALGTELGRMQRVASADEGPDTIPALMRMVPHEVQDYARRMIAQFDGVLGPVVAAEIAKFPHVTPTAPMQNLSKVVFFYRALHLRRGEARAQGHGGSPNIMKNFFKALARTLDALIDRLSLRAVIKEQWEANDSEKQQAQGRFAALPLERLEALRPAIDSQFTQPNWAARFLQNLDFRMQTAVDAAVGGFAAGVEEEMQRERAQAHRDAWARRECEAAVLSAARMTPVHNGQPGDVLTQQGYHAIMQRALKAVEDCIEARWGARAEYLSNVFFARDAAYRLEKWIPPFWLNNMQYLVRPFQACLVSRASAKKRIMRWSMMVSPQ